MKFLKNFDLSPVNVLKVAGLAFVAIFIVTLAFRLIGPSLGPLSSSLSNKNVASQSAGYFGADEDYATKGMVYDGVGGSVGLSVRNVESSESYMPPIDNIITPGDDAENFEVTQYNADIETRKLSETCQKIVDLKSRQDIIFENASEYEKSCNYSFKVKHNSIAEVLSIIESLNPRELNENTYTIKSLVEDYTSEIDILQKKLASIEETFSNAISAYDDIASLATRTQDVESLTKIIDSKVRIIERLAQEKININAQLERIGRAKAEQLDRLEYTYFYIYIVEDKFIDGQNIKDSWKMAVKTFVRDINAVLQDVTVNLVSLLFLILQYIVYLFIVLIVAKYVWRIAKKMWTR